MRQRKCNRLRMTEATGPFSLLPPAVTFRGRGLARFFGAKLSLLVCPNCSQRNAPRIIAKGHCNWCAYEPAVDDVRPAE